MPSLADRLKNAAKKVQASLNKAGVNVNLNKIEAKLQQVDNELAKNANLNFGAKKSRRVKKVKKSRSKKSRSRKSSKKSKRKTSRRKSKSRSRKH